MVERTDALDTTHSPRSKPCSGSICRTQVHWHANQCDIETSTFIKSVRQVRRIQECTYTRKRKVSPAAPKSLQHLREKRNVDGYWLHLRISLSQASQQIFVQSFLQPLALYVCLARARHQEWGINLGE